MPSRTHNSIQRACVTTHSAAPSMPTTLREVRSKHCLFEGYSELTYHYVIFDEDSWESGRPDTLTAVRETNPAESLSVLSFCPELPWDFVAFLKQTYGDLEIVYNNR